MQKRKKKIEVFFYFSTVNFNIRLAPLPPPCFLSLVPFSRDWLRVELSDSVGLKYMTSLLSLSFKSESLAIDLSMPRPLGYCGRQMDRTEPGGGGLDNVLGWESRIDRLVVSSLKRSSTWRGPKGCPSQLLHARQQPWNGSHLWRSSVPLQLLLVYNYHPSLFLSWG